jgi:branched-chain amino acid transport system permease protein
MMRGRVRPALALGVLLLVLVLAPLALDTYALNLFTLTYLMMAGALAWNWLGGFVGQVSFGHAAMFGVGGFVAARVLIATPLPAPLAWLLGGLAGGAFALLTQPTLRLRGPYFSIATIGLGEAARLGFTYWDSFTGGASGVSLPLVPGGKASLYFWGLALALLTAGISWRLRRSDLGLELSAIRSDVEAAADVGVSAAALQLGMLFLSGSVVGLSGALYASFFSFIEPRDMFGFDRSIAFVLMGVIGGLGTVLGQMLGAVVFVLVQQFLLGSYTDLYLGLYGALLVAIILFEPLGLSGLGRRLWRWLERRVRGEGTALELGAGER